MIIDASNPRWKDGAPVWDIFVDGAVFETGVTEKQFFSQMPKAYEMGLISEFDKNYGSSFGLRQWTVNAYVKSKIKGAK